jgi:DNA-binding NtrC family response regulator
MERHCEACGSKIRASATAEGVRRPTAEDAWPLKDACEHFEREYVLPVVRRVQWNLSRAARILRVHRNTLLRKLSVQGLHRPEVETNGTP